MVVLKTPTSMKVKQQIVHNNPDPPLGTATSVVSAGVNTKMDNLHARAPLPGDRFSTAFLTWSCTKLAYWLSPTSHSKQFFARAIARAWEDLSTSRTPVPMILVVQETHSTNNMRHMHAIIHVDTKVRIWHQLGQKLRGSRIICDVSCSSNPKAFENMMRYVLVPSRDKMDVDDSPFLSSNFSIPENIMSSASKARCTLMQKPADGEEVKKYIFQKKDITTWVGFTTHIDKMLAENPKSLLYNRMSGFISKNRDARSIVELSVTRMQVLYYQEVKMIDILGNALEKNCECTEEDHFFNLMISSLDYHDKNEPNKNSSEVIGNYYFQLFTECFTDRRQSLYLFGVPSSGKSTISKLVLNIIDNDKIFRPDYGSNFPFGTFDCSHIIADLNEFRASPKHSSAQWLLFLERSPLQIDKKNKCSEYIQRPPPSIITSNIITPNTSWTQQDIHAINERCVMATRVMPLPVEMVNKAKSSALHNRCKRCSSRTILWTSPALQNIFKQHPVPSRQNNHMGSLLNAQQMAYLAPLGQNNY